jgi:hypothetical protein
MTGIDASAPSAGFPCRGLALRPRAPERWDDLFANTDERMITFFCAWLRRFFESMNLDYVFVYLHEPGSRAAERIGRGCSRGQFGSPAPSLTDHPHGKHVRVCTFVWLLHPPRSWDDSSAAIVGLPG